MFLFLCCLSTNPYLDSFVIATLETLGLARNSLTGGIPDDIGSLRRLRQIDLDGNQLEGRIPSGLSRVSTLEILKLESNGFIGSMPDGICDLPLLDELYADCDKVDCPCCTNCCVENCAGARTL
jgi:Leucine-rich repeat (LRR) protein